MSAARVSAVVVVGALLYALPAVAAPPYFPNCPTSVVVQRGLETKVQIVATTPNAGATVTVIHSPLPAGAIFELDASVNASPGSTTTYRLAWTPTIDQTTSAVVSFQAQDSTGQSSFGTCDLTLQMGNGEVKLLYANFKDFFASHADFGTADGDVGVPIVMPTLGSNRLPVFNSSVAHSTVTTAASFDGWWTQGTGADQQWVATNNAASADPTKFRFDTSRWYPLDGRALGNEGQPHNQYFTARIHTLYRYMRGDILTFASADDLWVFIGGQLVVDLGGVHARQSVSLSVDSIGAFAGLQQGVEVPMDIFYAHRGLHPPELSLTVTHPGRCDYATMPVDLSTPFRTGTVHPPDGGIVRLINTKSASGPDGGGYLSGAIWAPDPVDLAYGFETDFDVFMDPAVPGGDAHGVAFVLGDFPGRGNAGSSLGYGGMPNTIAVELDGRQDVAQADPNRDHVSVISRYADANSASEVDSIGQMAADMPPLNFTNGSSWHLKVRLDRLPTGMSNMTVHTWTPAYDAGWHLKPAVFTQISDAQLAATLPSGFGYLGVTTGSDNSVRANIDLFNWTITLPQNPTATCGTGACERTVQTCTGGWKRVCVPGDPIAEQCNSLDDDCNGTADDGLGSTTCGLGVCERTTQNCAGGSPQMCTPGSGGTELCNGADDDCDGAADDGLGSTTCGIGGCQRTVDNCASGSPQSCVAGAPGTESCNSIDDDCDGVADDNLGATTCGVGACERTVNNCANGSPQSCVPGAAATETCNGADDDCDGAADENLGTTTCGVGVCQRTVNNCVSGSPQPCVAGPSSSETCNALDDDCDGTADDNLGSTTCGLGVCQRTVTNCVGGSPQTCAAGPASAETCNGLDDDCDGTADDSLGSTTCGVGACERTVNNCVNGAPRTCSPGVSTLETCNGIDDDCDGSTDENLGTTTCGVGACTRTVNKCENGASQSCAPGTPGTETCNGLDDDCDGQIDEGFGSSACGVGACARTVNNCVNGAPQTCAPGAPVAESCNGLDDDCDGAADESLGMTTCGVGACVRTVNNCVAGAAQSCAPGASMAETCNGIDDDCDGSADDDLGTTTCGVGACVRTVNNCVGGVAQACSPGAAATEACNGLDDDCDGAVDDDLGSTTCGVGACARTVNTCANGAPQTCAPGAPGAESCNGLDDDCDGVGDEELGTTSCGVGACARTVNNCVDGALQTCAPGAPATESCGDGVDQDCDGADAPCVADAGSSAEDAGANPGPGTGPGQEPPASPCGCTSTSGLSLVALGALALWKRRRASAVSSAAD